MVPALTRGFAILDLLANQPGLTFTEIHQRLGLPKSSAFHLLGELSRLGVVQNGPDGRYVLGLRLSELGAAAAGQRHLDTLAKPLLWALARAEQLTCHLGVLEGHQAVYLCKVECDQEIKINTWVGKRLCLNRSALGKVMLAWLPEAEIDQMMAFIDWEARTPKTLASPTALKADLALIRQRGWGIDDEEDVANIRCVAAPVTDGKGRVVAAISAVGTVLQIGEDRFAPLATRVTAVAEQISKAAYPR